MNGNVIVETRELLKIYGDGIEVRALDGVNLIVREGEFMAVMGPSGSGKSTLLNMIGALDRPTSGRVIVQGQDLTEMRDLDRFRSRTVGFVFQLHNLIPTLTARENVEIPMHEGKLAGRARRERAMELLGLVGLEPRADFLPNQLSGGERQRVAIARALANDPAIILADEPTGNLDSVSGSELMRTLRHLNQAQGTTIIVVTHDPKVARATDRRVTLQDGRLVDDHPVEAPLVEDLRELAHTRLGELLRQGRAEELFAELGLEVDSQTPLTGEEWRRILEGLV
ncbi:MAG: ABC transporter ATP-binding protein [Chloroflexota bacterium]|nr:ABC transporter ATP-binding protein [Chloroflexota bacterium]